MAGLVWDMALAGLLFAAALGVGWPWVALAGGAFTCGERLWLAAGLGYGLLSLATLGLGSAGVLRSGAVLLCAAVLLGAAWGGFLWYGRGRAGKETFNLEPVPRTWLWLPSVLLLLHLFLAALTPEVRADPLTYHVSLALRYAVTGSTAPCEWNLFSYFPSNQEMLYSLGFLFARDTAAKLVCFSHGVLLIAGVALLARRMFGARVMPLAVLLLLLLHWTAYLASTCYVDITLALYELLALFCVMVALKKDRRGLWCLGGVFAGLAMGTKYTVIPLLIGPLGAALFLLWVFRRTFRFSNLVLLGVVAVLVFAPWMGRNIAATGNPVFPLMTDLFGPQGAMLEEAAGWMKSNHQPPPEVFSSMGALLGWVGLRMRYLAMNGGSFPFLAAAVALLHWGLRGRRRKWDGFSLVLGVYFALAIVAFLFVSNNASGRFLFPLYAVMCVLLASWLPGIADALREKRAMGVAAVFVPLVVLLLAAEFTQRRITSLADLDESAWPVISEEARAAYYRDNGIVPPALLEAHVPEGGVVLGSGYPARVEAIGWHHGWRDVVNPEGRPYTPEFLADRVEAMGIVLIRVPNGYPIPRDVLEETLGEYGELVLEEGSGRYYRIPSEMRR